MNGNETTGLAQLLEELTEQLDNTFPTRMVDNMPSSPIVLLYVGDEALKAQTMISRELRKVWRNKADAIPHVLLKDDIFYALGTGARAQDPEPMDEYGLQDKIDEVQGREECFRSMGQMLFCTIESTEGCEDAEAFRASFESLEGFIEDSGVDSSRTIRFILLDESARGRKTAGEIRKYLKDMLALKPENETYFLISNRLRSGALLNPRRIRENYELIGSLILLADGVGREYEGGTKIFFPVNNQDILTAAYSRLPRPNRKITEIIFESSLGWIRKNLQAGVRLDYNDLCERLGVLGGSMEFIDNYFEENLRQRIPPQEILEFLPRASSRMNMLTQMPFQQFNKETFGSYTEFESRCLSFDRAQQEQFRTALRDFLISKISGSEAANSLTDTNIGRLCRELQTSAPAETLPAGQYYHQSVRRAYVERALRLCEEEMKDYYASSKSGETLLDKVTEEYHNISSLTGSDTALRQFYTDKTWDFLDDGYGKNTLLRDYSRCEGKEENFFEAVRRMYDALVTKERIFSMPLEEELAERMGASEGNVQKIIHDELLRDIEKKTRLKTLFPMGSTGQAILANRCDASGRTTLLSEYLRGMFKGANSVDFFDTGDSNLVEAVVFYRIRGSELPLN